MKKTYSEEYNKDRDIKSTLPAWIMALNGDSYYDWLSLINIQNFDALLLGYHFS